MEQNQDIFKELDELIKNKDLYSNDEYIRHLKDIRQRLRDIVIAKMEVIYEEDKIIKNAKNIINGITD